MGIARRKAGSLVICTNTKCAQQVVVPHSNELSPPPRVAPEPAPAAPTQDPFERDDLAAIFQSAAPSARGMPATVATSTNAPLMAGPPATGADQEARDYTEALRGPGEPLSLRAKQGDAVGLVLSPMQATVLTVVLILSLALSFLIGLLTGRFAL